MKETLAFTVYVFMFIVYLPKVIGEVKVFFRRKDTSLELQLPRGPLKNRYSPLISFVLYLLGLVLMFVLVYLIFKNYLTPEVFDLILKYKGALMAGIGMTVSVSCIAILLGTFLGCILAFIIANNNRMNIFKPLTTAIIYILLSIPALVLILLTWYSSLNMSPFFVSIIALTINLAPFVAKIIGSSLRNMPQDQINAAKAFGFSRWTILIKFNTSYVIRHSLQPLLVEYFTTIKLSSLVGYIGLAEAFHTSQDIIKETQDPMRGYIILTICYLILVVPLAFMADHVEKKLNIRQNNS